jgi:arylsulfatase A-like enzyme
MFKSSDYIIAEAWKDKRITAYRDKKWKFIHKGNEKELYNISNDKRELHNLYKLKTYRKKIEELEQIINTHIKMVEGEGKKRGTWLQKEKIKKATMKVNI